jgi:hypothetical protein
MVKGFLIAFSFFVSLHCQGQNNDLAFILKDRYKGMAYIDSMDIELKCEVLNHLLSYSGDKSLNISWFGYSDTIKRNEYNRSMAYDHSEVPQYDYCTNEIVALYLITSILNEDFLHTGKISVEINGQHVTGLKPCKFRFSKERYVSERRRKGHFKYRRSNSRSIKVYFEETRDTVLEKCNHR